MVSGDLKARGLGVLALVCLTVGGIAEDKTDFKKWEKEIAAFEIKDKEKARPKNGIVNRGFGGSQIADSVHFADRLIVKYQPRLVIFYAGDNDIAAGKSPEQVSEDFKSLVNVIHKDLPKSMRTGYG
jgi:lysophospholipase L1-like esterase